MGQKALRHLLDEFVGAAAHGLLGGTEAVQEIALLGAQPVDFSPERRDLDFEALQDQQHGVELLGHTAVHRLDLLPTARSELGHRFR